jgi:S1-C subfamily serine protease
MDALDLILLAVVVGTALHGMRLGAAVQFLSFGGALVGLAVGVGLLVLICPHVSGQRGRTFVALLLLLLPAAALAGLGRQLGTGVWRKLRTARFGSLDAAAGAVIAVVGTLVVTWFLASILVNSQYRMVAHQISNSRIIRAVAHVMPPMSAALAPVERFLNAEGLPQVYVDLIQAAGPVAIADNHQVAQAVSRDANATVKIVAIGCGQIQEGSGFVVSPDLVVTNAHVVAGTRNMNVQDSSKEYRASVVLFDPEFDLAILRVPHLPEAPLHLDPHLVPRGTKVVVLGYPGGGQFSANGAGVMQPFQPTSLDIYGRRNTVRTVYEILGSVRPGNSGGPLVEPGGAVVGVVFSRSQSDPTIGYALTMPGVLSRVRQAESAPASRTVGTRACIIG